MLSVVFFHLISLRLLLHYRFSNLLLLFILICSCYLFLYSSICHTKCIFDLSTLGSFSYYLEISIPLYLHFLKHIFCCFELYHEDVFLPLWISVMNIFVFHLINTLQLFLGSSQYCFTQCLVILQLSMNNTVYSSRRRHFAANTVPYGWYWARLAASIDNDEAQLSLIEITPHSYSICRVWCPNVCCFSCLLIFIILMEHASMRLISNVYLDIEICCETHGRSDNMFY